MVVMYQFCFWFSVRLGSIIVGAVSMLQAVGLLVFCSITVGHPLAVSSTIRKLHERYELLFVGDFLSAVMKDPGGVTTSLTVFMATYTFSCILLIIAAYKCNWQLALPYVGLDLARLALTTATFIAVVMVVKENTLDLGAIIAYTVFGGFVLLFLFYMWFCTVSFCQMARQVEKSDGQRALIVANITPGPKPWKSGTVFNADYRTDYRGQQLPLPRPAY